MMTIIIIVVVAIILLLLVIIIIIINRKIAHLKSWSPGQSILSILYLGFV